MNVIKRYSYWKPGERQMLSDEVGVSLQTFSSIIHRRLGVSPKRAKELEAAALKVLGKEIPAYQWIINRESKHPAFIGPPIKSKA